MADDFTFDLTLFQDAVDNLGSSSMVRDPM